MARPKKSSWFLAGVVPIAAAIALVVSGCSSAASETLAELEMAPLVSTHADVESAISVTIPARPATLDPLMIGAAQDGALMNLIGGTLMKLTPDASASEPALAESAEFSEDGLSYTVTLKEGTTFSDGSPLTPDDVVATFQRALNLETNLYVGQTAPVESVTAIDDRTIKFDFTRPYPSFETFLAYPNMSILKKSEIAEDLSIPEIPTFAGAYAPVGEYFANSFEIERVDGYVGPTPAAKTFEFSVVPDVNTRLQQVRTGQVDFASEIAPNELTSLKGDALPQVPDAVGFYVLNMNNASGLTADVNIRKAMGLALDRDQLSQVITAGYGKPLAGFFPSGLSDDYAGQTAKDIEAAKVALKGTECESGCKMSLITSEEWAEKAAVVIQQNLAEIGIEVTIDPMETQVMFERYMSADFELGMLSFGDYSTVPEGLPAYCLQYSAGYQACMSSYQSDDAEAVVNDLALALDDESKAAAMDAVNAVFLRDQPYVILVSGFPAGAAITSDASGVLCIGNTLLMHVAELEK